MFRNEPSGWRTFQAIHGKAPAAKPAATSASARRFRSARQRVAASQTTAGPLAQSVWIEFHHPRPIARPNAARTGRAAGLPPDELGEEEDRAAEQHRLVVGVRHVRPEEVRRRRERDEEDGDRARDGPEQEERERGPGREEKTRGQERGDRERRARDAEERERSGVDVALERAVPQRRVPDGEVALGDAERDEAGVQAVRVRRVLVDGKGDGDAQGDPERHECEGGGAAAPPQGFRGLGMRHEERGRLSGSRTASTT